jgi:hypothetical protein
MKENDEKNFIENIENSIGNKGKDFGELKFSEEEKKIFRDICNTPYENDDYDSKLKKLETFSDNSKAFLLIFANEMIEKHSNDSINQKSFLYNAISIKNVIQPGINTFGVKNKSKPASYTHKGKQITVQVPDMYYPIGDSIFCWSNSFVFLLSLYCIEIDFIRDNIYTDYDKRFNNDRDKHKGKRDKEQIENFESCYIDGDSEEIKRNIVEQFKYGFFKLMNMTRESLTTHEDYKKYINKYYSGVKKCKKFIEQDLVHYQDPYLIFSKIFENYKKINSVLILSVKKKEGINEKKIIFSKNISSMNIIDLRKDIYIFKKINEEKNGFYFFEYQGEIFQQSWSSKDRRSENLLFDPEENFFKLDSPFLIKMIRFTSLQTTIKRYLTESITFPSSKRTLYLYGLQIFSNSNHYVCFFKFREHWFLYDDLSLDFIDNKISNKTSKNIKPKFIGTFQDMINYKDNGKNPELRASNLFFAQDPDNQFPSLFPSRNNNKIFINDSNKFEQKFNIKKDYLDINSLDMDKVTDDNMWTDFCDRKKMYTGDPLPPIESSVEISQQSLSSRDPEISQQSLSSRDPEISQQSLSSGTEMENFVNVSDINRFVLFLHKSYSDVDIEKVDIKNIIYLLYYGSKKQEYLDKGSILVFLECVEFFCIQICKENCRQKIFYDMTMLNFLIDIFENIFSKIETSSEEIKNKYYSTFEPKILFFISTLLINYIYNFDYFSNFVLTKYNSEDILLFKSDPKNADKDTYDDFMIVEHNFTYVHVLINFLFVDFNLGYISSENFSSIFNREENVNKIVNFCNTSTEYSKIMDIVEPTKKSRIEKIKNFLINFFKEKINTSEEFLHDFKSSFIS